MKVSIIVPVYNQEKYVLECINSVLNQTYKDFELILIDNGSIDNSAKIMQSIRDKRIKIYTIKKNDGVAKARNLGIKKATSKYICFLDSDDYWPKDKLEIQVKFMEENNYAFSYGDYYIVYKNRNKYVKVPTKLNYVQSLKNTTVFTSTVMIDTTKVNKKDIYMPNIKRGQDAATWWHILSLGFDAYGINNLLAYYRIHYNSLSWNKFKALKRTWNLYKLRNIPLPKRIYYFCCYAFNAIKRRI